MASKATTSKVKPHRLKTETKNKNKQKTKTKTKTKTNNIIDSLH